MLTSTTGEYSNSIANEKMIAGWIATKANMAGGYAIYLIGKAEQKDFGKNAIRLVWKKGTTIAKIDAKKGKLIFIDNEAYTEGEVKYQTPMAYDRLFIDDSINGKKLIKII